MKSEKKPHGAWQWNPPPIEEIADEAFHAKRDVQSATECTGLMQQVPETESKARSLSALYAIHQVKPQGNVGKDNLNNPPEEIHFHRE